MFEDVFRIYTVSFLPLFKKYLNLLPFYLIYHEFYFFFNSRVMVILQ